MGRAMLLAVLVALAMAACAGSGAGPTPSATALAKIAFDTAQIDGDGLIGPPSGKRAVSYEFCIPRSEAAKAEVGKIDPTAEFSTSPGRIKCTSEQYLVIGHTHQPNWAQVLAQLAGLPYVERIQPALFE